MSMGHYIFSLKEIDDLFEEMKSILDDSGFTLSVLEDMEKIVCFLEEEVKKLGQYYRGTGFLDVEDGIDALKHGFEVLQNIEQHKEGTVEHIWGKYNHFKDCWYQPVPSTTK